MTVADETEFVMKLKWMVLSAAAGAAAMYFWDPENGERRRERVFATATKGARELEDTAAQASDAVTDAARAGRGIIEEAERAGTAIADPPPSAESSGPTDSS